MKQDTSYHTSPSIPQWGPPVEQANNVQSSTEDRQALLQAKKREALLASVAEQQDATGRYKRRDSDANFIYNENEEETLVYMHKIMREDTLAGVMLRYGCQQDAFRKINRLWPNDNIQTRSHVFLPVEACSVKGKKIDDINVDLLNSVQENAKRNAAPYPKKPMTGQDSAADSDVVPSPVQSEISLNISNADDVSLKHELG